jgi:hypothetical protein
MQTLQIASRPAALSRSSRCVAQQSRMRDRDYDFLPAAARVS